MSVTILFTVASIGTVYGMYLWFLSILNGPTCAGAVGCAVAGTAVLVLTGVFLGVLAVVFSGVWRSW